MHRLERGNQELEEDVELLKIAGLLAAKKVRRFRVSGATKVSIPNQEGL